MSLDPERVTIYPVDGEGRYEIHIAARRHVIVMLPCLAALIFLTAMGKGGLERLLASPWESNVLIWVISVFALQAFFGYVFLWNAFGREIIAIDKDRLTVKKEVLGVSRKKDFSLNGIVGLKGSEPKLPLPLFSASAWGLPSGAVSFEYDGELNRFAHELTENEQIEVLKVLKRFIKG